eukprot:Sspe_Gene.74901::Locus_46810_Transcript_1_2_Confidence_0.667_Length_298::g.74901::m.74901
MDQEEPTIEVKRKDKQTCKLTFFKAPFTKDVKKGAQQFVDGLQFLGDIKQGKLVALDTSVASDDPTLGAQVKVCYSNVSLHHFYPSPCAKAPTAATTGA